MNHEILFRGKRVDNGEWFEGDGIQYPKPINRRGTCWIGGMKGTSDWAQVIPETVGRYTGLTDKNGRKIFEGDILDLTPYMITDVGVVKFGEYKDLDMTNDYPCGHVGFYVDIEERHYKRIFVRKDILFFVSECKVLGNIHDNPVLLKGENND